MTLREFRQSAEYQSLNAKTERAMRDIDEAIAECGRLCPPGEGKRWAVTIHGTLVTDIVPDVPEDGE